MTTASSGDRELPAKLDGSDQQRQGRIPSDTFANRLVLARRLEGLTIREAAARCELHYATWSTWEAGRRPADIIDVAGRVADCLDIDRQWLLFGGPLTPAKGRPTVRPIKVTYPYPRPAVRALSDRPDGLTPSGNRQRLRRRAVSIDRSEPVAA